MYLTRVVNTVVLVDLAELSLVALVAVTTETVVQVRTGPVMAVHRLALVDVHLSSDIQISTDVKICFILQT